MRCVGCGGSCAGVGGERRSAVVDVVEVVVVVIDVVAVVVIGMRPRSRPRLRGWPVAVKGAGISRRSRIKLAVSDSLAKATLTLNWQPAGGRAISEKNFTCLTFPLVCRWPRLRRRVPFRAAIIFPLLGRRCCSWWEGGGWDGRFRWMRTFYLDCFSYFDPPFFLSKVESIHARHRAPVFLPVFFFSRRGGISK